MGRLALWVAQTTASSTPSTTPGGGPGGGPREHLGGMRGGFGGPGGPGQGPGGQMRGGAEHIARHMDGGDHHWWMLVIFVVAFLVIVGLLVWAIVAFSKATKAKTAAMAAANGPSAKEQLDQRLAKGDISPEDYEARKKLLDG